MLNRIAFITAALAVICFATHVVLAYTVEDVDRVYYGDPDTFDNPASVVAATVFAEIPEYKEIIDRGLTKKNPEFWLLLSRAYEKFRDAVAKAAEKTGYDLVAEAGAVTPDEGEDAPPDITNAVINAL